MRGREENYFMLKLIEMNKIRNSKNVQFLRVFVSVDEG